MCRIKQILLGLVFGPFLITGFISAQEDNKAINFEIATSVTSAYMFRGFNLYDGTSIQPSFSSSFDSEKYGTFTALAWSSFVAERPAGEATFTEVDYDLNWSKQFGNYSLAIGHFWYTYPSDSSDLFPTSQEVYISLAYDGPLTPVFTAYHDYDAFDTQYYELGLSHEFTGLGLGKGFNLSPYATLGFASNSEKLYEDDGLVAIITGVSMTSNVGDVSVTPSLNYNFKVDEFTHDNFWFELALAYSF